MIRWSMLAILCATLSGCGGYVMLASKTETFNGHDVMTVARPRPDILDVVAGVGKSMGYKVSSLDRKANAIGLSSQTSLLTSTLIGKVNHSNLNIQVQDAGKTLDLTTVIMGNLGSGGQEAADKLVQDFKKRLEAKLMQ